MSNEGFKIDLDEAEITATRTLPSAVGHLRQPVLTLAADESLKGAGSFDAADRLEPAYHHWGDIQARRLRVACDVLEANASALREIINLYRRADGRL
ncbi:hypothetical protein LWC34_19320 [Kibdelosporangium philippinense]|uniref:Uncharacterized protein n=1 Tax=Kibdelosporangium philippinense TaxID=211113 RepID=A0ABS8ZDM0_9PSEU|nr:hypothetical protein [Kibdelosporangium philippinense]MCE7004960.1 hypothetical protein [Kibdelosporangium philippinense]